MPDARPLASTWVAHSPISVIKTRMSGPITAATVQEGEGVMPVMLLGAVVGVVLMSLTATVVNQRRVAQAVVRRRPRHRT